MKIVNRKALIRDFPIILSYYIFPFIGIIHNLLFKGYANFEFVWICLFFMVLLRSLWCKYPKKEFILIFIIILAISLKYILPFAWNNDVILRPLVMDIKWLLYLSIAFLWIHKFGKPKIQILYNGALFFCKVYILFSLFMIFVHGHIRAGLLSESNYDCFLFLIGYCFISNARHRKLDYLIFFIATALSLSQTGLASYLLLTGLIVWQKNRKLLVVLVPIGILLVIIVFFIRRGDSDISSIDRFVFFMQCYEFFKDSDITTIILGTFPGTPMKIYVIPAFQFYIENFENMNDVRGCYAFYFHSTYLRLAITWGIPILACVIMFAIYKLLNTKYLPLKLILSLFLLESISLSTLTLTTVSVPFFIALFSAFHYNKKTKKHEFI